MENAIHSLTLDLTGPDMCPMIEVQRGDSARSLIISLTQGGRPYWIEEGLTAAIFATKPDGNPLFNACTIEQNRIRYDFTPQTANVAGAFDCEIWLVAGDKREITTPRFTIAVDERMRTDDVIPESAPEYTAITEMVAAGTAMIEELREALAGLEGVEEILTRAREAAEAASNSEAAAKGHAKTAADAATDALGYAEDAETQAKAAKRSEDNSRLNLHEAEVAAQHAEAAARRAEEAAANAGQGGGSAQLPADLFGGYDRFYRSIARGRVNPEEPLDIATYDGSGQLTHPCVRHFPGGFGGHSWWMAASPYPNSALGLENPCVWYSDDGIRWSSEGIPNPLALPPTEGGEVVGYNSDPHLLLRPDGVMEVWWRTLYESGSNAGYEVIWRRTSADGINWTEPEELHRERGNAQALLCPVALHEDGVYRIWVVRQQEGLRYYESADGTAWQHIRDIDVSNPDYPEYKVWHFDVNRTAKGYEFVGNYNIPGDYGSFKYLYYAVSQDNITYSKRVMILARGAAGGFDERLLYRPTIVRLEDRVRIYYGAQSAAMAWGIGLIEAPSAYLFNAVLISGARVGAIESGQEWLGGRVTALEAQGGSGNGSGQNLVLDTTLTQSGKAADAKAVGDILTDILKRLGILESYHRQPIYNLPVLRLVGDTTGMSKETEVVMSCEFVDVYGDPFFAGKVAEVKWQGDTSIWYDKKNYGIKLYESDGETKFKFKPFDDVSANNGYHIKANFIDAWHCRNIVTVNLAKAMYVKQLPSGARGVIDGFPIVVEINGEKQGLYTFNLKQHKSVYGLDEDNPNHLMYRAGSNNADVCKFRALSTNNAEDTDYDWEDRFPETNTAENRAKLNRLIAFVKDSDDATFKADFGQYLDLDYTIDYWILCYFGGFTDSLAKNMNIVTYDGNIWYPTFYDCDTTWGIAWNGGSQKAYNIQCPSDYEAKDNLLWERLVANFPQEIYDRYFALRDTFLKVDAVVGRMKAFIDSIPAEEYEEDRKIWTLPTASIASGIDYMTTWIAKRAAYVDGKMGELVDASVALEGISISQTLNVSKGGTAQMEVTYTPVNATNKAVSWESSDDSIATVDENGLVTAVGVGNCTITCTSEDGGHTAECYLGVSEPALITDGMVFNFDLRQPYGANNKWASSVGSYTFGSGTPSADKMTENGYAINAGGDGSVSPAMYSDVDLDANGMTLEAVVYGDIADQTFRIGNNFYFSPGEPSSFHMFDADGKRLASDLTRSNVINADGVIVPFATVIGENGFAHIVFRADPTGVVDTFLNGCKFTPTLAPDGFDHFEANLLNSELRIRTPYTDIVLASYRAYGRPLSDEEIMNNYYVERAK